MAAGNLAESRAGCAGNPFLDQRQRRQPRVHAVGEGIHAVERALRHGHVYTRRGQRADDQVASAPVSRAHLLERLRRSGERRHRARLRKRGRTRDQRLLDTRDRRGELGAGSEIAEPPAGHGM